MLVIKRRDHQVFQFCIWRNCRGCGLGELAGSSCVFLQEQVRQCLKKRVTITNARESLPNSVKNVKTYNLSFLHSNVRYVKYVTHSNVRYCANQKNYKKGARPSPSRSKACPRTLKKQREKKKEGDVVADSLPPVVSRRRSTSSLTP